MKADERRKSIVTLLLSEHRPVSGSELSALFGVSRQIIVHDISVLKAAGYEIIATHQGYIIHDTPLVQQAFKMHHTTEQTEDELNLFVKNTDSAFRKVLTASIDKDIKGARHITNYRDIAYRRLRAWTEGFLV